MIRGITKFKCHSCGHVFKGMDMEYAATAFSVPLKCPECGSIRTCPRYTFFSLPVYKEIWKSMETDSAPQ